MNIAGLLPILLLGVVFWALLIRPQQRAKSAARLMQNALSPGDEVTTVGGIFGVVRDVDDATVDLEISEDVIVRFDRRAVNRIVRDIPAEEAEQHRIGDEEAHEVVSEAPAEPDAPTAVAPTTGEVSDPVDAPEAAR